LCEEFKTMSNLLPETTRRALNSEYRARFILAGSLVAIVSAVYAAIALSPSYGVLFMTRPEALEKASLAQKSKTDTTDVATGQFMVTQLSAVATASSTISTTIMEALEKRP